MADSNSFRDHLEKLKETTDFDFDVDKIIESVTKKEKIEEEVFDREAFMMARIQMDSLIKGFEDYYASKGRGLRVTVEVTKENAADTHGERWVFDKKGNIEVISLVHIGTKGKYQPVEAINR